MKYVRLSPTPKQIPIGLDAFGNPVWVGLSETNLLIAGQPGAGKSGTLATILAQVSQLPNVALITLDPKQVELGAWAARASYNAPADEAFALVLEAVYHEMERRYAVLKSRGLKKITPEMWVEFPQLLLVIDELAKAFTDPIKPNLAPDKTIAYFYTRKLVAEGRAAGISLYVATQRPSADLIPTSLRNLIQQKIAHAMARETDTRMVLGDVEETTAHLLPANAKGVGFLMNEGSRRPVKFRASLTLNNAERDALLNHPNPELRNIAMNYPTIEEMVAATTHLRVPLPFLDNNYALQELQASIDERDRQLLG